MARRGCSWLWVWGLLLLQGCNSILHVPDGARYESPDGRRSAVVQQGRVVLDGRPEAPRFDGIAAGGVVFSRDGRRMAYIGMRGSQNFLVVDGQEHGPFDGVVQSGVAFSPAGTHVALLLRQKDHWHVWLDGHLGRPWDGIAVGHPVFSADDVHAAWAARRGDTWVVELDGAEQVNGSTILAEGVGFTADGRLYVAYKAGDGWRVRLGDAVGEAYDGLMKPGLIVGPKQRALAYIGLRGKQVVVCVDMACGPPHAGVGTRVRVDSWNLGEDLLRAVFIGAIGGVIGGLTGTSPASMAPMMPTTSGSPAGRYLRAGSVVFSPDERHHAYVGSDEIDRVVVDGRPALTLPVAARVDWMRFDVGSQVLMLRVAGEPALRALPVADLPRHEDAGEGAATLLLRLPAADTLVFADDRFAGVAPERLRLAPGRHVLHLQSPGRQPLRQEVDLAAGQELMLEVDLAPEPVRQVVQSAIERLADPKLLPGPKLETHDLWRGRLSASLPLSEEVLGLARYGGGNDALLFGDRALWVYTESSSRSSTKRSFQVSYADLARAAPATGHRAFEVELTPEVVINTAGMSLSKDKLLEFLQGLRNALAALPAEALEASRP